MLQLKTRIKSTSSNGRVVQTPTLLRRFLGWCVHAYTALGLVIAAVIAVLLIQGGGDAFRWSFILMGIATIVDATDGTLARRVRIKEAVPSFDGRRLDDLTDFLTYTCLPLLLIWRANILPAGQEPWLIFALLASAYGFCQVDVKTEDGYFLGFPSLWNLVALYLYVLPIGPWPALAIVVLLAFLTFVPARYLYPSSQPGTLNRISTRLGALWTPLLVWFAVQLPSTTRAEIDPFTVQLALASLFYPIFYLGASWLISINHWRRNWVRS
jgi:phosphatidylcholine synthase